jgi:excisionase family DNA binding protein
VNADLETGLRTLIAEIVRNEVRTALAGVTTPDEYLSTSAAAAFAQVADGTIRRWIREGRLVEHRAGRVMRVRRADLQALLQTGRRSRHVSDMTPEDLAARDFG